MHHIWNIYLGWWRNNPAAAAMLHFFALCFAIAVIQEQIAHQRGLLFDPKTYRASLRGSNPSEDHYGTTH